DWSSDVCSSDLRPRIPPIPRALCAPPLTEGGLSTRRITRSPGYARRSGFRIRASGICREVAGRVGQDPEPHGCGDGAYTDVLAACPAQPCPPPSPQTIEALLCQPTEAAQ